MNRAHGRCRQEICGAKRSAVRSVRFHIRCAACRNKSVRQGPPDYSNAESRLETWPRTGWAPAAAELLSTGTSLNSATLSVSFDEGFPNDGKPSTIETPLSGLLTP